MTFFFSFCPVLLNALIHFEVRKAHAISESLHFGTVPSKKHFAWESPELSQRNQRQAMFRKPGALDPEQSIVPKKEPGFGQGFLLLFKLLDGRLESHRDTTRGGRGNRTFWNRAQCFLTNRTDYIYFIIMWLLFLWNSRKGGNISYSGNFQKAPEGEKKWSVLQR